jgi:hypothetical protein
MKLPLVLFAMTGLVCTLDASSITLADSWPQGAKSRYLSSCITIAQGRWRGAPESNLMHFCNCKLSALQKLPAETVANPFYLEMYLALPTPDQKLVFSTTHENLRAAMHLASTAENECNMDPRSAP